MKILVFALLLVTGISAHTQYYYKDIIGTKETADLIKNYKSNNVSGVVLTSYDENNTKSDNFFVEQKFDAGNKTLKTFTRSDVTEGSALTSYIDDNGNVIKTVDSSETITSTTLYNYDASNHLISVSSSSSDTSLSSTETEEHIWQYNNGKLTGMLRIKDGRDTTFVTLKTDDNGNIIEEQSIRKGVKNEPVYYYYDKQNRLTDIVRYNNKAKRLLPEYMFEYSPANQVIQKITVPANGSDYLIWRYQYDNRGLKIKEAIFNKQKQLTGKIEYRYQYGS